jgi:alkyl hydroperoxide reductase subunit AhpF
MNMIRTVEASGEIYDMLVIGAGPTGLACAIEAKRAGFRYWWTRAVCATPCFTIRRT